MDYLGLNIAHINNFGSFYRLLSLLTSPPRTILFIDQRGIKFTHAKRGFDLYKLTVSNLHSSMIDGSKVVDRECIRRQQRMPDI
jgi:hypothetical protein